MENELGVFGALESPKDYRDVPLSIVASSVPLPEEYQTDISMLTMWHQKKNGSCVGHAFAKIVQYYFYKKTGRKTTRQAVADYMSSEGCSCCEDRDNHKRHEKRLAKLLKIPMYKDGSGCNYQKFISDLKQNKK